MPRQVKFWRIKDTLWKLRGFSEEQRTNLRYGFDKDFELPFPYPQNEHEEGMNWIAVNGVPRSGRADW